MANTIMVFVHVLSAIFLIGGIHYLAVAVLPWSRRTGTPEAAESARAIHHKFRILTWVSIGLLLLTGLHLLGVHIRLHRMQGVPHALWTKIALAMVVIVVLILDSLPMAGLQSKRRALVMISLILGTAVVFLGVYVSRMHLI